jgi:DNA-binding HxlR family transcriptional regulator
MRAGAQTLSLLATPLNCLILQTLSEGPKAQVTLRRETGLPAQTTIRAQLRKLFDAGTIVKGQRDRFPGTHAYELTDAGEELLFVASVLERWLAKSPEGRLTLRDNGAKAAVGGLAAGWSTALLRALAARPLTLTDLNSIIGSLNYPALQRRISAMRLAGQLEVVRSNGKGNLNQITDWLREGVAPIVAAARWERRHLPDATAALGAIDTEMAFLLAIPLLRLDAGLSGSCRLAAELPNGERWGLAGVMVEIAGGRVASCMTRLEGVPEAWILGSPSAWLSAVIDGERSNLELGGDSCLAGAILDGLHGALFGAGARI